MFRVGSLAVIGLAVVCIVAGCGGSGGNSPAVQNAGVIRGSVDLDGSAASSYELLLDGVPVPAPIAPDGSFTIPAVPPGSHVVEVIGADGMSGGRAAVAVSEGEVREVPPIEITLGGQIVGILTKRDGKTVTPLPGVEIVATSDVPWMMGPPGAEGGGQTGAVATGPVIYPPPPDRVTLTYKAVTDEDGSYRMKAVKPGSYLVTAVVPGLTRGEQFVWVEPGRTAVADFQLEPVVEPGVGTVQGTVTGANPTGGQEPLEGALVQVFVDIPWRPPRPIEPIWADPRAIPGLPPGPPTLPGMEGSSGTHGIAVMPPDIIWNSFATLTDKDGKYSLNVPSGRSEISVWAYGYQPVTRSIVVQPRSVQVIDFQLTPQPPFEPQPVPNTGAR